MTDSPEQPQTPTFYIDPDYANLAADKIRHKLKFKTLYDQPHPIILLVMTPISLLFLALGLILVFFMPFYEWSQSQNPEVEAAIIACKVESHGKGAAPKFTYTFPLITESGERRIVTSSDFVGNVRYRCDDIPLGAVISVKYDPDNPEDTRITDARLLPSPILNYGMLGCMAIAGIYALLMALAILITTPLSLIEYVRAKRKYPRLRRTGVAIDGVVEVIKHRKPIIILGKSDRDPEYRVRISYRFTSPDGISHTGMKRFYCHAGRMPTLPTVGTPVKILYAADNCHVML